MKAIRVNQCGEPAVLMLEELPEINPGPGEILVQVKAAGVNPVDTYLRAGAEGYQPKLPYTPGLDGAGVVLAVGTTVTRFGPGDRVYLAGSLTGTYAQCCLCSEAQVYHLPDCLSFSQGAAIGIPYATAYRALFQRGGVKPNERVLIHGASGGVGLASLQLCRSAGIVAAGTAGSPSGQVLVKTHGAMAVFNHREAGYLEQLKSWTANLGFDLIVEMLANVNLGHDLALLASHGRVIIVGSRGPIEINPRLTMAKDSSILGFSMLNVTDAEKQDIHAALAPNFANGSLQPVIHSELPLSEAPRSHSDLLTYSAAGKIVLVP